MNKLQLRDSMLKQVGETFEVDPSRITISTLLQQSTQRTFCFMCLLIMPPDPEAPSRVMAFTQWTLIDGDWIQTTAYTGPVK